MAKKWGNDGNRRRGQEITEEVSVKGNSGAEYMRGDVRESVTYPSTLRQNLVCPRFCLCFVLKVKKTHVFLSTSQSKQV